MLGAIATKISQDCRTHPTGWLNVSEKFELGTCKIDMEIKLVSLYLVHKSEACRLGVTASLNLKTVTGEYRCDRL